MSTAALALGAVGVVLIAWNAALAGAIARTPAREGAFRTITALAGLFLVPAVIVAAAALTVPTARVADGIWWFWPLAVTLFAIQSTWAVATRLATPLTGGPIALWNIVLTLATWSSALVQHDRWPAFAPEWADATLRLALATLVGHGALTHPLALWLPVIGPAYPPRWGLGRAARRAAALGCTFALVLVAATVPRARELQRSFGRMGEDRVTERPRADFGVGLRVLPVLDHPPPPQALALDLALADTMESDLLLVEIAPTVLAGALDSLARVLDEQRHDSAQLAIAPALGADAAAGAERERMLVAMERAVRRLQPEIVFSEPVARAGAAGDAARRRWFEQVRTATRRGGSRARVLPLVRAVPDDAAWFHWADSVAGGAGLVFDATAGGDALAAELRVASAWLAPPPPPFDGARLVWALGPRGAPLATGEGSQARALWGLLAWGTRTAGVTGLIAGPTADYARVDGLRDAGGRPRAAQATLVRSSRGLHASAR